MQSLNSKDYLFLSFCFSLSKIRKELIILETIFCFFRTMHFKERSAFLSTNSASSLIGSGNGSAPNSMQSNQNMVSPLLFHDQDTACPPFPQRKELVAQVARIYWPHLINATKVQPGSLFLSLHFITAFVIMQAPRHQFLEARAILQSSIWL